MATTKTAETTADTMKTRLFAFVRETTERAKALEMGERVKASKAVSESTAGTYARLAKSRLDTSSEKAVGLWTVCPFGLGTQRGPPCFMKPQRHS